MTSLWGEDFAIPNKAKSSKQLLNKINSPKTTHVDESKLIKSKKVSNAEKITYITAKVNQILGVYKENTVVIKTLEGLQQYLNVAVDNGVLAFDTETNNSLVPITCKLMGVCIYTPTQKNAYIPINHVGEDNNRLEWQLTESDIFNEFSKINDKVKIITHNGKFDYEVIKCTCGLPINIFWDTLIGAKLLDENERAGLKEQYITKIDSSIEKYDIEHLFEGLPYEIFDPELFALYAATDAYMTYKLYMYQLNLFNQEDNRGLRKLADEIEMPLVTVIAEMELAGMDVDQEYAQRLSVKYHRQLEEVTQQLEEEIKLLQPQINQWRLTSEANFHPTTKTGKAGKSKNEQLSDEINFDSPTQLAILLYDVLKCPVVDKDSPRGTGEEILIKLKDKMNLSFLSLILKRRGITKLLNTYIDSIPELAKANPDGRVRTHFNQYGADTGRLSSSDPLNFQNIPSDNKEIRLLFKASDGYKIIGGDYSAQEPRLAAYYSQDPQMIEAYLQDKDLYAVVASQSFGYPYEECLEHYSEGTEIIFEGKKVITGKKTHTNVEGKERRSQAKKILLGLMYGRGEASIGEQLGKTVDEAKEIINKFFNSFPVVKQWIDNSVSSAKTFGYVEDFVGRRRRLPDILLPKYTFKAKGNQSSFNPLLHTQGIVNPLDTSKVSMYRNMLNNARSSREVQNIKQQAEEKDGIIITNNGGFIARAERQAVNARVQGGAATITKIALLNLYRNEELKNIGAKIINAVHDEILLEVPEQYEEIGAELLSKVMIESVKKYVTNVPMKTDTYIVSHWYEDEYISKLNKQYVALCQDMSKEEAFTNLCNSHTEMLEEQIRKFIL